MCRGTVQCLVATQDFQFQPEKGLERLKSLKENEILPIPTLTPKIPMTMIKILRITRPTIMRPKMPIQ